jgi:hypothetical protein
MRQGGDSLLSPAAGVAAVMAWWRVLQARVVQLRHRTKVGAAWRRPSRAPRQSPPAVTVTAAPLSGGAALHRPLGPPQPVQLRRQRPGAVLQIPQIAVAVERPAVNAAGQATPVAGLGGARTGVVGLGPASTAAGLAEPRAGRDSDLPRPVGLPAAHEVSPPLAWLPGSDQPTRRARPSRSRIAVPPYSPPVGPAGHGRGRLATRRRDGRPRPRPRPARTSGRRRAAHRCALTRQVWPVDQAISPSPRASRDVAGHTAARQPGAARATAPAVYRHGGAGLASPRSSPWARRRWP